MLLMSAREAADRLGVKLDTLYAYVSRGLLRSSGITTPTRSKVFAPRAG
jgi:predicted site-specific integrase-resolvase